MQDTANGSGGGGGDAGEKRGDEVHVPLSSYIPCYLQVSLVSGKDLASSKINLNSKGKGDPFVIFQILKGDTPDPSKGVRSRIIRNTMDPVWNDVFQFNDVNTGSDKLAVMAFDFVRVGKNPPLGSAIVPLSDLVKNVAKDVTIKLNDPPNPKAEKKGKKEKERGTVQLILTATDNERDEPPVIKEGYLKKEGGLKMSKSLVWQNRYLMIRQGVAHYKEFKVSDHLKGSIKDLTKCKVYIADGKDGAKIRGKQFFFNVKGPDRTFKFKVTSDKERQEWMDAFVQAGCTHEVKHREETATSTEKKAEPGKSGDNSLVTADELNGSKDKPLTGSQEKKSEPATGSGSGVAQAGTNSGSTPLNSDSPPKYKSLLTEALRNSNQEISTSGSTSTSTSSGRSGTMSEPKITVFVTGALGNCGFSAVRELVSTKKKNTLVKAGVRSVQRAEELKGLDVELVEIDAEKIDTLVTAFQGVDRLFIIPTSAQNRTEHVKNYVAAAKKTGVKHVVLLSLFVAGAVRPEHKSILFSREFKEMEDNLEQSGLSWTRLRATFFIQNFFGFQDSISRGLLSLPIGEGAFSPLDLDDLSRLASLILLKNDNDVRVYSGKTYILTGPQSLDGPTLAREISRGIAAGRPKEENDRSPLNIKFVPATMDEWKQNAMEMGFPEWHANGFFELLQIFARNEADFVSSDFQNLTGREPNSIAQFFMDNVSAFT